MQVRPSPALGTRGWRSPSPWVAGDVPGAAWEPGSGVGGVRPRAERTGWRPRGGRRGSDSWVFACLGACPVRPQRPGDRPADPRPARPRRGSAAPGREAGTPGAAWDSGGAASRHGCRGKPSPPPAGVKGTRFNFGQVTLVDGRRDTRPALAARASQSPVGQPSCL